MEFEQLIKIIETVSNSSLTSFHYEAANGEKIDIDRPAGAAVTGGTASEAALAGTGSAGSRCGCSCGRNRRCGGACRSSRRSASGRSSG